MFPRAVSPNTWATVMCMSSVLERHDICGQKTSPSFSTAGVAKNFWPLTARITLAAFSEKRLSA